MTRNGEEVAASSLGPWWDNAVLPLPDNSEASNPVYNIDDTGHSSGEILVLGADRATQGYHVDLDKIALLVLSGAGLSYGGASALNCNTIDIDNDASDRRCLILAGDQSHLWVEGALDGAN